MYLFKKRKSLEVTKTAVLITNEKKNDFSNNAQIIYAYNIIY